MSTQKPISSPSVPVSVEPNPVLEPDPRLPPPQRAVQLFVDPCACNCVVQVSVYRPSLQLPALTHCTGNRAKKTDGAGCASQAEQLVVPRKEPHAQAASHPRRLRLVGQRVQGEVQLSVTGHCREGRKRGRRAGCLRLGRVYSAGGLGAGACCFPAPTTLHHGHQGYNPACLPTPTRTCTQQCEARPRLKAQTLQRAAAAGAALEHGGPHL